MNDIEQALRTLQQQGCGLARFAYARGEHAAAIAQAAEEFSTSQAEMKQWWGVGKALFGPAPRGQAANRDASVAAAEEGKLSIQALVIIDKGVRALIRLKVELPSEQFRLELTQEARGMTIDELKAHVNHRLRLLNPTPAGPAGNYARVSRGPDPEGYRYLIARVKEQQFAGFLQELEVRAKRMYDRDSGLPFEEARARALLSMQGADGEIPERAISTAVVLTAHDLPVASSEADHFLLTDGTLIRHDELAAVQLAPHGIAILYDPNTNEPINAWRTARTANALQSEVLNADQGLCAVPGCQMPAESCHNHHLKEWRNGGNTNLGNLGKVCPMHHAWIDRGPDGKNGTLVRGPDGRIGWLKPGDTKPRYNQNPATRYAGRALASKNQA